MPRLEDAAIPMMNSKTSEYKILAPENSSEDIIRKANILNPFDNSVLSFINEVSELILNDRSFRRFPELVAMAFWMRKANISRLLSHFDAIKGNRVWLARGIVFHIAPSNVDTIFIYSWFLSMLAGNINIVRISSKLNEPVNLLLNLINDIVSRSEFSEIGNRFLIIQYEHNDEITGHFSSSCDVRVIWGGDETIRRIRRIPLKSTSTELTFADKFSFSVIDAKSFISSGSKEKLINNFFNDAYWFGQNACSSPRLVVWLGRVDAVKSARDEFWSLLGRLAQSRLENAPAVAVDKLMAESALVIKSKSEVIIERSNTALVNRAFITHPDDIDREIHCGGGLFYEIQIGKLAELAGIINSKDQTMSVFGIAENDLRNFIAEFRPGGINRIVPIGQSLTFSSVWDGYDLLREFTREINFAIYQET